jgi:hypothetical protein
MPPWRLQRLDRIEACAVVRVVAGDGVSCGFELPDVSYEQFRDGWWSCHGPSAAHVKDPKNKTPWPAIVQCVKCHTEKNCPQFDYQVSWGRIIHGKGKALKKD